MRLLSSPTVRRPVAVVLGLLCAGSVAALSRPGATGAVEPGATPARLSKILVLGGDALSSSAASTVEGSGALYGWDVTVQSSPGSGFARTADPATGAHVVRMRKASDLASYDLVVVQGGEADRPAPGAEVEEATLHLIDYLRAKTRPGTGIALVGPVPESAAAATSLTGVSTALQQAATARDVPYVDLAGKGWVRGANDQFLLVSMLSATSPLASKALHTQ